MKSQKAVPNRASAWQSPESFVEDAYHKVRTNVDRSVQDVVGYAREYPEKALLWAASGGYVLRMLPVTGIIGSVFRLVFALLKPAALIYGAAKVWQTAQPVVAPRKSVEK